MEPGTLPPAVSSRSAGAAPSRFSVPAKPPSSRRSPAPGSPTAPAAPAGSPPRQRSLPAAFSKPFSFVSRLLSASPPPHRNRGLISRPRTRVGQAWVRAGAWSCIPRGWACWRQREPWALSSPRPRVAVGLRESAWLCGGYGAEATARPGAPQPLEAPSGRCLPPAPGTPGAKVWGSLPVPRAAAPPRTRGTAPHGPAWPRCAAAVAVSKTPRSGARRRRHRSGPAGEHDRPPEPPPHVWELRPPPIPLPRPPGLSARHLGAAESGPVRPRELTSRPAALP